MNATPALNRTNPPDSTGRDVTSPGTNQAGTSQAGADDLYGSNVFNNAAIARSQERGMDPYFKRGGAPTEVAQGPGAGSPRTDGNGSPRAQGNGSPGTQGSGSPGDAAPGWSPEKERMYQQWRRAHPAVPEEFARNIAGQTTAQQKEEVLGHDPFRPVPIIKPIEPTFNDQLLRAKQDADTKWHDGVEALSKITETSDISSFAPTVLNGPVRTAQLADQYADQVQEAYDKRSSGAAPSSFYGLEGKVPRGEEKSDPSVASGSDVAAAPPQNPQGQIIRRNPDEQQPVDERTVRPTSPAGVPTEKLVAKLAELTRRIDQDGADAEKKIETLSKGAYDLDKLLEREQKREAQTVKGGKQYVGYLTEAQEVDKATNLAAQLESIRQVTDGLRASLDGHLTRLDQLLAVRRSDDPSKLALTPEQLKAVEEAKEKVTARREALLTESRTVMDQQVGRLERLLAGEVELSKRGLQGALTAGFEDQMRSLVHDTRAARAEPRRPDQADLEPSDDKQTAKVQKPDIRNGMNRTVIKAG